MERPILIGIVPLYDKQRDSLWMIPGYMDGIIQAGGLPLILPFTDDNDRLEQLVDKLDGFLFPGGQDVQPEQYGEVPRSVCGETCRRLDKMESRLLRLCRMHRKPVLGICRGIQLFNAVLGGTLYQDIPTELPSIVEHHMKPPYDRSIHKVTIEPNSLLYSSIGKNKIEVNSYHHQGIKELSPMLMACAWAPDGLIEAVEDRSQPYFLGIQWHPELSLKNNVDSRNIFADFVEACGKKGRALGFYTDVI